MGLFLNNIQVWADGTDGALMDRLALLSVGGLYMQRVESEKDADIETRLITAKGSKWITIISDRLDGDYEFMEKLQFDIAEKEKLPALTVCCIDSDFVYLQLLEPDGGRLFASTGRSYEGRMPIVEHPLRWRKYLSSLPAFHMALAKKQVFAEDNLAKAAPALNMDIEQARAMMDSEYGECDVKRYFFSFPNYDPDRELPLLNYCRLPPNFYEGENTLEVENARDRGRGVKVEFSGPVIDGNKAEISKVQLFDAETDKSSELALTRAKDAEGNALLIAEAPDFPLPRVMDDRLPTRMAEMRKLYVSYTVTVPGGALLKNEDRMSVRVIPLQNPDGWCTRLMSMGERGKPRGAE